jgi:hypothetical protein
MAVKPPAKTAMAIRRRGLVMLGSQRWERERGLGCGLDSQSVDGKQENDEEVVCGKVARVVRDALGVS